MLEMAVACAFLLLTHFGLSSTPLRAQLAGAVGEQGFQGIYSLIALAALGYCIWLYSDLPRLEYFWYPNPDLYWVPKVLMPLAAILAFGGFLVKNPTQVGMEKVLAAEAFESTGLLRVTRHPFMWGVVLWGLSHLIVNGDAVSVVFFSTFIVLAGVGTLLMDRKKAASLGDGWPPFAAQTSNVPFGAILSGRNKLAVGELWQPAVVGLVVWGLMFYFHEWLSGVPLI